MGMFNGDYVFITLDFQVEKKWEKEPWMKGYNISTALTGFLDLSVRKPSGLASYDAFSRIVRKRMIEPPFYHAMNDSVEVKYIPNDTNFYVFSFFIFADFGQICKFLHLQNIQDIYQSQKLIPMKKL